MNGYYILPDSLISIFTGTLPATVPGISMTAREICKLNKPVYFNLHVNPETRLIGVGTIIEYANGDVMFVSPSIASEQYRYLIRNDDVVTTL